MSGGKENKRNSSPIKHQELKSGGKKKKQGLARIWRVVNLGTSFGR